MEDIYKVLSREVTELHYRWVVYREVYAQGEDVTKPRFQIISATFMERCRRGSQLLKVVRSSRQRNKQYYHELSAVDRGQKIPDFCSFGTGNFGF